MRIVDLSLAIGVGWVRLLWNSEIRHLRMVIVVAVLE